jgi:succinate dehydrogenase/fumarate reductase flavoprotein subunit
VQQLVRDAAEQRADTAEAAGADDDLIGVPNPGDIGDRLGGRPTDQLCLVLVLDASGRRFTDELAPRDQVTAAVLARMDADGTDRVALDLRGIDPARFPNVFAACHEAGLTPEREPVPVAPAAHYLIGGIVSDLHGRSTLPGLYAVGECACTGCTARTTSPPTP